MSAIAVLGAPPRVDLWRLAGAVVIPVQPGGGRAALEALPGDVDLLVLTPEVAAELGDLVAGRLVAVMP